MELTTEEEVHVVCLFPSLEKAMEFDSYVYSKLLKIKNDPIVFGEQRICMLMIILSRLSLIC